MSKESIERTEERSFVDKLEEAEEIAEIFEVVKDAVRDVLERDRSGLMLGLADLGNSGGNYFGAYYPVDSNIIVMNKNPLIRLRDTNPSLYKPYVFYVLLHEYLHTLGILEEGRTRELTYIICRDVFGEDCVVTRMAQDITGFIPNLVFPHADWKPENFDLEFVEGFDSSSFTYIG